MIDHETYQRTRWARIAAELLRNPDTTPDIREMAEAVEHLAEQVEDLEYAKYDLQRELDAAQAEIREYEDVTNLVVKAFATTVRGAR